MSSFPDQNQHMLYSLMAHISLSIFGEHVWALRVPSVLFGVASIWALFLLGRRLIGERPALLACALMTVSYHHIWFSQNARGYMGLLFFTLVATWLWLEAMDDDRWSTWVRYAVSIALGMWIHMTIVFVVAAHALIFLFVWLSSGRAPKRLGRAVAAYGLATTLSLQLIAIALPEFLRTGIGEVLSAHRVDKPALGRQREPAQLANRLRRRRGGVLWRHSGAGRVGRIFSASRRVRHGL